MTIKENSKRQATPTQLNPIPQDQHDGIGTTNRTNTSALNSPMDITQYNYDDHWQEIEIDLDRVKIFFYFSLSNVLFFSHRALDSDFPLQGESIHLVLAIHLLLLLPESLKVV